VYCTCSDAQQRADTSSSSPPTGLAAKWCKTSLACIVCALGPLQHSPEAHTPDSTSSQCAEALVRESTVRHTLGTQRMTTPTTRHLTQPTSRKASSCCACPTCLLRRPVAAPRAYCHVRAIPTLHRSPCAAGRSNKPATEQDYNRLVCQTSGHLQQPIPSKLSGSYQ
jgi:hypothetical protein